MLKSLITGTAFPSEMDRFLISTDAVVINASLAHARIRIQKHENGYDRCYTWHMEHNYIIKLVYTFFVGILLALFVGVGVDTFYPGPKAPDYTNTPAYSGTPPNADEKIQQKAFEDKSNQFNQLQKSYSHNVSIITLIASILLLALSILLEMRIRLLSDGVMLGGLFTLLYSIARGFASDNSKYVFVTITVGLIVVLYLGYHRFVGAVSPKNKS